MVVKKSEIHTSKGKLQYQISGSGKPNIVLINGGSGPIEGWMKVLPGISESSTVFAYNRLGVAGSDKPQQPQDGRTIVEHLREALQLVGFEPPYLLVGHSLGGLYANLYARLYPDETAGVVFLESSTPGDISLNQHQSTTVKTMNKLLSMFDFLSPHKKYDEVHYVTQTVEQIHAIDHFHAVPVYVITGGKGNPMMPEALRKQRLDNQLELLALSPTSIHIPADKSGHFPQFSEPTLVVDAIKACIEKVHHRA
ncbi:alpha/beta fold hydrolase [Paenibacillus sp. YIM B09110]|uniref:alpha/beta fold hydrolase n=1 Tax=Paenibacillus sp. YIM B09110 TaxID=3126102 RepID=UPI00301C7A62